MDWNALAVKLAEVHFEHDFSIRWLVGSRDTEGKVYVCNNSPPRGRLSTRDEHFQVIAKEAAKLGLIQVGYGEFPVRGPEEGYSCVAIFGYPDDRLVGLPYPELRKKIDELCEALQIICQQAFAGPIDAP